MNNWVIRMPWKKASRAEATPLLMREWLVTNGLGGYASGTISGAATRRFHGLLIAALPAPLGRRMVLNHISEQLRLPDGSTALIGGEERVGAAPELYGAEYLKDFRLESGLPVWLYEVGGAAFEKRVLMPHLQNTVHVNYRLIEGKGPIRLKIRPSVHFRPHEGALAELQREYKVTFENNRFEICAAGQQLGLRLVLFGERGAFTLEPKVIQKLLYRIEESRGYESVGDLWSPGYFRADLDSGHDVTLVGSTEAWEVIQALNPHDALAAEHERRRRLIERAAPAARSGSGPMLVFAADQFLIKPAGRVEDAARAHAAGDEVRTVIAGYHWFTDWGRDTMISLEGLTLSTGRYEEAGNILRTFAHYVRDGLIPNLFPEGESKGLYHTADATLWFFHAIARYLDYTNDRQTLRLVLPKLVDIIRHHERGTHFHIGVDPKDGLLSQGEDGYQLTWMDAKVGDWVVTPRRGKAVELNALWYNALRLMETWVREEQGEASARPFGERAEQAYQAFNEKFWYQEGGYLYDVIGFDGKPDAACRPNQVFAISLPHPVLDRSRWESVMTVVQRKLLTPVGLRSLAPGHPDYKPQYYGDLRARDAAYHQGTVWAWLIGPFIDAWLKLHPDSRDKARHFLDGLVVLPTESCIGSIAEIFDAEKPFTPRGCLAQAWSVAEVLRCWVKTTPQPAVKENAAHELVSAGTA